MAAGNKPEMVYGKKVWTPQGLLSYPKVFKPEVNTLKNNRLFFSCNLLLPKGETFGELTEEMSRLAVLSFGEARRKASTHTNRPIRDGDLLCDNDGNLKTNHPEAGHWVISASTGEDRRPMVVDRNGQPITDQTAIYGGAIGMLLVVPASYKMGNSLGITLFLSAVMKLADGESFGGITGSRFNALTDLPASVEVAAHLKGRNTMRATSPEPQRQTAAAFEQSDADAIMLRSLNNPSTYNDIPF